MSARKKLAVIAILVSITYGLLPTPTYAQENLGEECKYTERREDGNHECDGTFQKVKDEDGNETEVITCQYDPEVTNIEACVKEVTAEGEDPSEENYGAAEHTGFLFANIITNGLPCLIGGDDLVEEGVEDDQKCGEYDSETGEYKLYDEIPSGGAIGGVSNLVLAMYASPALSSSEYLADLRENIGVKPAYAQLGTGSTSGDAVIKPVLEIWKVTRNLSYLAFIIVFVVVGFMIMLRAKISPQAVVTAQAALPGLVIGLILVTFSYFIAALIVDLSFIAMNLVVFLFSGLPNAVQNAADVGSQRSVFEMFRMFALNGAHFSNLAGPVKDAFQQSIPVLNSDIPFLGGVGGIIGGVIGALVMVIVMVAILIQMFRLLWELIKSYIAIFVTTIFGPFIILASSLPGRGGTLAAWWKSLLGNVLVFPAVFAAFLFAGTFLALTDPQDFNQTLPLFAGLPTEILRVLIAYGIILGTPAIPGMVKKAIGVPDIGNLGTEAGAGFRRGQAAATPLGSAAGYAAAGRGYRALRQAEQNQPPGPDGRPQPLWIARQPVVGGAFNMARARLARWARNDRTGR